MPNKRALGLILKTARKSRGIRQSDISPDLGITPAALSHIEAGRNTASREVLEAYARHLVTSDDIPRLVDALLSVDSDSLTEISALLNPKDPEGFEKYISQALASPGETSRMSQWNFSPLDSVPRRAMRSMITESSSSTLFDERDSVTRALRSFIMRRGGKVVIAGRESSDFGLGFSMKCDLVETTRSLVIEVKSANRFESRFIPEMVGKTVLLRDLGFQFVLCFTAPPTSRLDEIAKQSARQYGARVVWPEILTFERPETISFAGDNII